MRLSPTLLINKRSFIIYLSNSLNRGDELILIGNIKQCQLNNEYHEIIPPQPQQLICCSILRPNIWRQPYALVLISHAFQQIIAQFISLNTLAFWLCSILHKVFAAIICSFSRPSIRILKQERTLLSIIILVIILADVRSTKPCGFNNQGCQMFITIWFQTDRVLVPNRRF